MDTRHGIWWEYGLISIVLLALAAANKILILNADLFVDKSPFAVVQFGLLLFGTGTGFLALVSAFVLIFCRTTTKPHLNACWFYELPLPSSSPPIVRVLKFLWLPTKVDAVGHKQRRWLEWAYYEYRFNDRQRAYVRNGGLRSTRGYYSLFRAQ